MKLVNDSLLPTGIPAYADIWQPTTEHPTMPDQYYVYSVMRAPVAYMDDRHTQYRIYLYLNLWSGFDPTEAQNKTRTAMYKAGWSLDEETTRGYKQPAYDDSVKLYCVIWTWVYLEEATDVGNED